MKKRVWSLLLVLVMLISLFPSAALAAEEPAQPGPETTDTQPADTQETPAAPSEEDTAPADEDVTPSDEIVTPPDEIVPPADETAVPVDEDVTPSDEIVTPPDETAASAAPAERAVTSVTVNFTSQAGGAFLHAPQFGVEVSSDLAESYGYTDQVTDGVSALDVLVKAHKIIYGSDFTKESKDSYLTIEGVSMTAVFGFETTAASFVLNGACANDGIKQDDGYNGYGVNQAPVHTNDMLEFLIYQDPDTCSENIIWFCKDGKPLDTLTAIPSSQEELVVKGLSFGWYGYKYPDADTMHAAGSPICGLQLAWVDITTGQTTDIISCITDGTTGAVTVPMPAEEGTYYLSATGTDDSDVPVIMPLFKVIVTNDIPSTEGSCELSNLQVGDFDSNPSALSLKPNFSSDVTEYTVDAVNYQQYAKMCYVKATAISATAIITATLNGTTKPLTSGDTNWVNFNNMQPGENNLLTVTVKASDAPDAKSKTYTVTIPMRDENGEAPAPAGKTLKSIAVTTPPTKTTYTVGEKFEPAGMVVTATYSDDTTEPVTDYTVSPDVMAADTKKVIVTFEDKTAEVTVTVTPAPVPASTATITVPSNATLFVGTKGHTHYVPFTPVELPEPSVSGGTKTYQFDLPANTYNFRVSGDGYVTCGGTFKKEATKSLALAITEGDLAPAGKSPSTIDRELTSNNGFNVADIYLNINNAQNYDDAQNYLKLNTGDTYQIVNLRTWEAADSITNNYFIEPDFHYTVLNESGQPSSNVVTVDGNGLLTAKGSGTAIVLVTYDAMNLGFNLKKDKDGNDPVFSTSSQFYGAIWPENTGVFVVSVDAGDSGITTGMTMNAGRNTTENKRSGDALDAEHDVIYYLEKEGGSYTFTPGTPGCTVSVATPTVSDTAMSFSGFQPVTANTDGSFTVPLTHGRNIVKITKDGKSEYQIITAKPVTVTVNEDKPVHPGDAVRVQFSTLYHPSNKLAKFYNMYTFASYTTMTGVEGTKEFGSTPNQYKFASTTTAQTLSTIRTKGESYGNLSYVEDGLITIPADFTGDSVTLSGGAFHVYFFGEAFGSHRRITYDKGIDNSNPGNAETRDGFLGQLPDIVIPLSKATVETLTITKQPTKTSYVERTAFDGKGMELTAHYSDGSDIVVTNYTVSPAKFQMGDTKATISFGGKSVEIDVTVTERALKSIKISQKPTKLVYTAGDPFDTTGMIVTATYTNDETENVTNYTFSPSVMEVGKTYVTIHYTEKGVTKTVNVTGLTVNAAQGGGETNKDITVLFTLLGDDEHGEDETHTLKDNNLKTWIDQTSITVPQNAKVINVIDKALRAADIPYESNSDGNYIASVRDLAEFSNGSASGWMYTLNGRHPDLGVNQQTVRNGDEIILHYTDDYNADRDQGSSGDTGSGGSGGGSSSGGETQVTVPIQENKDGSVTAKVPESTIKNAIADVKSGGKDTITIAPEVKKGTDKVTVELPKAAVSDVARQTSAAVEVKTDLASVMIPNSALAELSKQAGSQVGITVEAQKDGGVKIDLTVGGKSAASVAGGIAVSIPAAKADSGSVLVLVDGDGKETVIKKSLLAEGAVTGLVDGSCTVKVVDNAKSFQDAGSHWAKDAIAFASSHELFGGVGGGNFAPDATMDRAMLATVLYRLEDAKTTGSASFTDVPAGAWYADAVAWANGNGIVKGSGNGFDPSGSVTREQLATMLYRYAQTLDMDTKATGSLDKFSDGGQTSGWAKDAMSWAVGSGLLSGKGGGTLDPSGSATRAEVAAIMQRMVKLMVQ